MTLRVDTWVRARRLGWGKRGRIVAAVADDWDHEKCSLCFAVAMISDFVLVDRLVRKPVSSVRHWGKQTH